MLCLAADAAEPAQEELGGRADAAGLQGPLQPQREDRRQHAQPGQELPQGQANQQGRLLWDVDQIRFFNFLNFYTVENVPS